MRIQSAEFVTSAASAGGVPRDGVPQVALVGRSNVGKSSLINALVRRTIARTSASPGKTRLINLYRIVFDRFAPVDRLYLVDLPGFGYARGGEPARAGFAALMEEYFGLTTPASAGPAAVLLLVDARHPGLPQDMAAWDWIQANGRPAAVVVSKIDKLSRAERARTLDQWTHQLKVPVLPTSAATGEGLDDLWTLIVKLLPPPKTRTANAPEARVNGPKAGSTAPEVRVSGAKADRPRAAPPRADQPRADQPRADQPRADRASTATVGRTGHRPTRRATRPSSTSRRSRR